GDEAKDISKLKVKETEVMFIERVKSLAEKLKATEFYENKFDTFDETFQRISFMKQVIENTIVDSISESESIFSKRPIWLSSSLNSAYNARRVTSAVLGMTG
ncbi:hypothetical protein, partial [Vibrio metschnikovii]|uniref:hypothetical protein n=1 Tax=Vibrio metschnikovii TaxID=28172 RepID=UPI002FC7238F